MCSVARKRTVIAQQLALVQLATVELLQVVELQQVALVQLPSNLRFLPRLLRMEVMVHLLH